MSLATFWQQLLISGDAALALFSSSDSISLDDPLVGASHGRTAVSKHLHQLSTWAQSNLVTTAPRPIETFRHIRGTDHRREFVESILAFKNGLIWKAAEQKAEVVDVCRVCVAVVGDKDPNGAGFTSLRVYYGTWAVFNGTPKERIGPIVPRDTPSVNAGFAQFPVVDAYFQGLRSANVEAVLDTYEPDAYFREPANNYECGMNALRVAKGKELSLGGIDIEFQTATFDERTIGVEIQTVKWGPKVFRGPQAGFAAYELGESGRLGTATSAVKVPGAYL
ncbi:hypothetical protein HDU96_006672 [Phlyctochytrium bullatum]|nr:hypothetical protein HDU96_006672 [Phlyctochytrium bullatum]